MLLKALPARTGLAFVLVQHLDPTHESQLSEILSRTTTMPVVVVTDGMPVQPNRLHVIPSNTTMTIEGGSLRLAPRQGTELPMPIDHFLSSLARAKKDSAIGVVLSGSIEDVTETKELEQTRAALVEREQALRAGAEQATQAKDRFLAVLSHELRSPLQSMLGWIRLLRSGRLSAAHAERALDVFERNTVLQARLIDDLLDVSRITAGALRLDLAPMMVASAVQTVTDGLRPAADAKRIRLVVSLEDGAGPILGDAARVQQIVGNLVSNAMKFTPSGGRIEVRAARRGFQVEIQVRDTGAGISPDQLPHVVAPFGTKPRNGSQGGLGLGLGIARHLAELHGGALDATSAGLGQGATFTLRLPLTGESPATSEALDRAAEPGSTEDLAGRHVLVLEDDADTREVITAMLEQSGAVVTAAATVAAALSELERATPDVLLSDLSLPERDGYDFIRSVRALDPARGGSIPAIALTAYASTGYRERVMAAGFQRYLAKPIDLAELVAEIASLADR